MLEVLQSNDGAQERFLYDVLTIDDRPHQPGAIAVQFWSHVGGHGDQLRLAIVSRTG
jgi:hypothetical protein